MKIGIGYDIHALKQGRRLVLGGVEIPHAKGLVGHSDGDAVLHARHHVENEPFVVLLVVRTHPAHEFAVGRRRAETVAETTFHDVV